jgi:glycosyltransferase involved in cell wall biosynthesis
MFFSFKQTKAVNIFFLLGFVLFQPLFGNSKTKFAICICSYNNEEFVEWNLSSVINQNYDNDKLHIYYINDMSTDGTLEKAKNYIRSINKEYLVTFIDNQEKRYPAGNHYHCVHDYIKDDNTVVVTVDGDDALANSEVLNYLDRIYSQSHPRIYLTYGQFIEKNSRNFGFCEPMPQWAFKYHKFRQVTNMPSHLRTFYAWLFKKIRKEDLCYNGTFAKMTGDMAMMLPMIEMASGHFCCISDILYIYNDNNPISDHKVDFSLQCQLSKYFRELTPYRPVDPKIARKITNPNKKSFIW